MTTGKPRIGTWKGPGVLLLIDGNWLYYTKRDASKVRTLATCIVGTDEPVIAISRIREQAK